MGSKPTRDDDSPSASSFLVPQIPHLRHSRRGSLASLSSINKIDKETLSQALDQIHNTASQTETLTTFNEYTSPPLSSSGIDGKGIASDLQGGLTGLYNRFKASVGNVKDIVNAGGDAEVADKVSARSPKPLSLSSPAVSAKRGLEALHSPAWSNSASISVNASGRQSPIDNAGRPNEVDLEKKIKPSKNNDVTSISRSEPGLTVLSPPTSMKQATAPTTVNPAVAEVNVSAIKAPSSSADLATGELSASADNAKDGESIARTKQQVEESADRQKGGLSGPLAVENQMTQMNRDATTRTQYVSSGHVHGHTMAVPKALAAANGESPITSPTDSVQPFPDLVEDRTDEPKGIGNSTMIQSHIDSDHRSLSIDQRRTSLDDVFSDKGHIGRVATPSKSRSTSKLQHLEIPLRRSIAPPLISRSQSPNPTLSRASSTDTNTDSFTSVPRPSIAYHDSPGNRRRNGNKIHSATGEDGRRDPRTMNVFSQVKNKVLNKEYWMKDENARDCFYCGDAFSTFRRKHHCRTCGQIFDAKCTTILSGHYFGQPGTLRVCKPCEGIISGNDDSSEFSDDGSLAIPGFRPRHGSTGASDVLASPLPPPSPTSTEKRQRSPGRPDFSVPTMSIPATRKAGEKSKRKPTVLEIDAEHTLTRPSSSRSLKNAFATGRGSISGHRRHNSRHQLQRGFKPADEDSAPFHQDSRDSKSKVSRLPTFHDDNIIDPDLAPYLSDEASSGDEQVSIMAALHGEGLSKSHDTDKHGLSGLLASAKKGRSRLGDKSISGVTFASRDADNQSLHSARSANFPRSVKRRNMSLSSRPSSRNYRPMSIPSHASNLHESTSSSALAQLASSSPPSTSRMVRSSSMRGAAAPPVELNHASLRHVRRLLHQLLEDSGVSSVTSWEKALTPILLRATDDVNPDVQNGDDIDIRHYVKLKKISGGRPGDTSYVSGLVFTKNLALKCMPRNISHPNILIITFPIEYARHHQHFMSLEPVIRQEREFLQNLVNRIAALRPHLLLVERNVSGLALEFLEQAAIATAYNVKASVLEAVSRCCQTRIISSIDKLAVKPVQAGKCASFNLKTYVSGGRKKTYMFLSGCAKELGCTIVLRGDTNRTLAKIKSITEFMIYVVYNLKLETCLMRDEFALIPSIAEHGSISPTTDPTRHGMQARLLSPPHETADPAITERHKQEDVAARTTADISNADLLDSKTSGGVRQEKSAFSVPDDETMPEDIPMPTFYGDMVEEHKTKILSASPFVKFMQPYLLMRAREQERRLAYLKRLRDQDVMEMQNADEKPRLEKFDLIEPEMVHEEMPNASRKVREVLHAVHDAEYDKALHNYQTQSKQWEAYISGNINLFDPFAHQNIAVLYSVVCTATTVPCSGPDSLALGFYNEHETDADFEADCTLGQYVEDLCVGAKTVCTSNGCEKKMIEHHRQYVHGEAQLSVFVERHPCKLRGLEDTILMWSVCRLCGKETQVMPMSQNTWKYSFGKYLELSFWSNNLKARAGVCPHDIHRNHLRYFGFQDMALRVHYDPITLLEIIVPRARITWKVENDLRFKNESFAKMGDRINKFMSSVKARIKSINTESVLPEKVESCRSEVEQLAKRAADEHFALTQKLQEKYMDSRHYEIIPLNRAIKATQEKVAEWDNTFADFDRNFFPSEKDIRRLATLQLKKIFMEPEESLTSLVSSDDSNTGDMNENIVGEKECMPEVPTSDTISQQISPEKAHDMLVSVLDDQSSVEAHVDQHQSAPNTAVPNIHPELSNPFPHLSTSNDILHLDLAVTPELSEKLLGECDLDTNTDRASDGKSPEITPSASQTSRPGRSVEMRSSGEDQNSLSSGQHDQKLHLSDQRQTSSIPKPVESTHRVYKGNVSPTLSRAQTQPAKNRSERRSGTNSPTPPLKSHASFLRDSSRRLDPSVNAMPAVQSKPTEKRLSERLGLAALKAGGVSAHSMIPRSIVSRRKETKVSNLAKHFEQLSREFEKERIRERRQRAAKSRRTRAYPMAASKPIVQVYRNVHEAVEEKEPSDEDLLSSDPSLADHDVSLNTSTAMAENQTSQTAGEGFHAEETVAEGVENINDASHHGSDFEGEENRSDEDHSMLDELRIPGTADDHPTLSVDEAQMDLKLDLPKHEKSSLMKMLTNFWAERSASGWQSLEYPLNATDHIFADSDIVVREDEPSSLIAFALGSEDYQAKLSNITDSTSASTLLDEKTDTVGGSDAIEEQSGCEESLLRPTGTHLKYQFAEGSARMLCKVFYAEQFDALRRKCGVSERIVESLSRCMKWDSKGGKTKSVFLKTLDDRFVLKSLSPIETQAFLRFAPAYFRIMSESLFHELPSVIAKMLGFYQIIIKNPVTGVEFNWFLLVMENLFYDRSPTRIFDLKGSMRNRRIQSTGEQNEVLLDENMVEFIYESPLFSREHSKKLLRASVWNDTLFLSRQNVMDYSLMIAIDENRKELVVGIIDCIRTYTWDKKLESWIKDRGKNRPTVTSPKEYKSRFREAMGRYVLQAPNCWHQFNKPQMETRPLRAEDPGDDKEVQVVGL